jgi:hypothetical protein
MILDKANKGSITLLYGTKNENHNNAIALKEYLEQKMKEMQKSYYISDHKNIF